MIEDLTGNIKRVVDGIAEEIAQRVAADSNCDHNMIKSHVRQVLYEWFLGEFIPHK